MPRLNNTPVIVRPKRGTWAQINLAANVAVQNTAMLMFATDILSLVISDGSRPLKVLTGDPVIFDGEVMTFDGEVLVA